MAMVQIPFRSSRGVLTRGTAAQTLAAVVFSAVTATAGTVEILDASGTGSGNGLVGAGAIAVDATGNVCVAGYFSDNVFKVSPAGVITEIIGAAGDGAGAVLDGPYTQSLAMDGAGTVYVTGALSNNAFKIDPSGVVTQIIDATGDAAGNVLDRPMGITVDTEGNVYVAGLWSDNAFKVSPAGTVTELIDATGDGTGNVLDGGQDIAVDTMGNVYVTGLFSDNAFKITPGGTVTEIIDATGDGAGNILDGPRSLELDTGGNVYIAGFLSDKVFKVTPVGVVDAVIDAPGPGANEILDGARAIAIDGANNIYLTGPSSDNAYKISVAGVVTEIIDMNGDGAGNPLGLPQGIAVDHVGRVYVSGYSTYNAFRIDAATTTTTTLPVGVQDAGQQRCINAMNNAGWKVAKVQAKENAACIQRATRGLETSALDCLRADGRGKVARARRRTTELDSRHCAPPPGLGYSGAPAVNDAAVVEEIALVTDLYGPPLTNDTAIALLSADRATARCQSRLSKVYEKIVGAKLAVFLECKKTGLRRQTIASAADLRRCFDEVTLDVRNLSARAVAKLSRAVSRGCAGVDIDSAFAGACAGAADLASCVDERVACRVCRMLNAADTLTEDCDLFDDTVVNASCGA